MTETEPSIVEEARTTLDVEIEQARDRVHALRELLLLADELILSGRAS